MKKIDLKLLKELRKNSRESLAKISRKTKVPITTLFYRLREQEKRIIKKHTVLLNYKELGWNARVHLALKVKDEQQNELKDFLLRHYCVNSLYKLRQGRFYVELVFKHELDADDFLEEIKHKFDLEQFELFHVIDDIKLEKMIN
jgi:DNA-binding Lrp family transcriptional regulator